MSIDFNHNSASAIIDALGYVVGKKWEKFQPGMIMSGVSQIECVILQNTFIKSLNEKYKR